MTYSPPPSGGGGSGGGGSGGGGGWGGTGGDPYEPNDSTGQARTISLGTSYSAKISPQGDRDFFRFVPSSSGTFRFAMTVPSDKDYDVRLLDANGGYLTSSAAGIGAPESMTYEVQVGRTYYCS